MRHPDTGLAYLFWLVTFSGFAGLHRFYLGRPLSGMLYLLTWGWFGVGTVLDAIRMPELVRRARLERRVNQLLEEGMADDEAFAPRRDGNVVRGESPGAAWNHVRRRSRGYNLERAVLTFALDNHGLVTPSRAALAAETTPEKTREQLERLVVQGFAAPRVTRDGAMIYVFPEFLDDHGRRELEQLTD